MIDQEKIIVRLKALASSHQAEFSSSLIPGCKPMLGVKLPELRKIAKKIAKEDYRDYMEHCSDTYFEQEVLAAYVIGYAKDDIDSILSYADAFTKKVHNWSVSDSFCQNFTIAKKEQEKVYEWLCKLSVQKEEFPQRIVAVILMSHFLNQTYIDRVLSMMDQLSYDGYYTKMGVAWCIATAFAKFPKETAVYLHTNRLCDFTYNKAIQKMCESFRVSAEDKAYWREQKRKEVKK